MTNLIQDQRTKKAKEWLLSVIPEPIKKIGLLTGNASFRSYFRIQTHKSSFILMDVPPDKLSCTPFITIAKAFSTVGILTPTVYAENIKEGFLLVSDLGDSLYFNVLSETTADKLYGMAFLSLMKIQQGKTIEGYTLPAFDEKLYQTECRLFIEWYLGHHHHRRVTLSEEQELEQLFSELIQIALAQPQVWVHRDYHCRNLIYCNDTVGILDFQDLLWGPITYDLMSLLRDCYIDWPLAKIKAWTLQYQQQILQAGMLQEENPNIFWYWFNGVSLQRLLKCLGLFSRLYYRDQKKEYLNYIPRVIHYIREIRKEFPQFSFLSRYGI